MTRIREKVLAAFDAPKSGVALQTFRDALSQRCQDLVVNITDIDLKAFCLRLLDSRLAEVDWLESVGSYVATTSKKRVDGDRCNELSCRHGTKAESGIATRGEDGHSNHRELARSDLRRSSSARRGEARLGIMDCPGGSRSISPNQSCITDKLPPRRTAQTSLMTRSLPCGRARGQHGLVTRNQRDVSSAETCLASMVSLA